MSEVIRIKRGLDINLTGAAEKIYRQVERSESYALKPPDFIGVLPKLLVKPGDEVNVGSPLFFDKYNPRIIFTSTVSGKVSAINRGERRLILEVVVEPSLKDEFIEFRSGDPLQMKREEVIELLLESGMWPVIRTRPFSVIANPEKTPKAIFISGFDSAPLAPDLNFIVKDYKNEFQKGLDALSRLTEGKIHLSVKADNDVSPVFTEAQRVELHRLQGPHPAGNVGIQIHHIDPINKGERVWYVSPQDVIAIGHLFLNGRIDNSVTVALTGSEVVKSGYYKLIRGSNVISLVKGNVKEGELRYISGDVLTGSKIVRRGYLGYYNNQITVIPEGNKFDFLGWASLGFGRFSVSRSYWSWLNKEKKYTLDTNLKGGRRAFVLTGIFNKVLPMDIFPVHLIKAIMIEDIDLMENLGIYEVAPEDFALCEFVDVSKIDIQKIIRHGLDLMKKETE